MSKAPHYLHKYEYFLCFHELSAHVHTKTTLKVKQHLYTNSFIYRGRIYLMFIVVNSVAILLL